jgi:hypothetical protein
MELPNVTTVVLDEANDIRYEVVAYRELSKAEALTAVRTFHSMKKRPKKLKRGTRIRIVSIIGARD